MQSIIETKWGGFTGGAAPLDEPMRDSGLIPKDQLRRLADIFINDMGMSPEEVLSKPEFAEQGITDLMQLEENTIKEGQVFDYEGDYLTMDDKVKYGRAYYAIEGAIETLQRSKDPEMQKLARSLDEAQDTLVEILGRVGIYY